MYDPLEQLLRQTVEPRAELRGRIGRAIQAEAGRAAAASRARRMALVAAMGVLWIHLAWSIALQVQIETPAVATQDLAHSARQIQDLLPDLPATEVRHMALRLTTDNIRPKLAPVPSSGEL